MGEVEKTIGVGVSHMNTHMISWISVLKGLLSGSLVVGSVIVPAGIASIILFLVGIYVFIDSVIPYGKQSFPILTVAFFIVGSIITGAFTLAGLAIPYMWAVIVITVIAYISKIRHYYNITRSG